MEVCQMQVKIQNQAKEEMGKLHREHYLREQIRALKIELGDSDSKDDLQDLWKKGVDFKTSPRRIAGIGKAGTPGEFKQYSLWRSD
jgi:ATP-dependent Lon protease